MLNLKIKSNRWTFIGIAALASAAVALTTTVVKSQGTPTVQIDGSSTVYPLTEAVAEQYQNAKRGQARVTVGVSGTGGGFEKFCAGETDISNASRPIKDTEMEACQSAGVEYMEIPVAYDAITVVVNPGNSAVSSLTVAELKKMWEPAAQGKITKWNQVRSSLPNASFKLYGPGPDSGTFDYFTDEIVGEEGASRTDYTPSEDDNVLVQGVSRDPNALGYFGLSYYLANQDKLKVVGVDSGKGAVTPSLQTVQNGSYSPLSRPLFIYVNADSASKPEVKEFVDLYLSNLTGFAEQARIVPLGSAEAQESRARFSNRVLGSASAQK